MNLLPFENLIYESSLSETELSQRISQFIQPKKIRFIRDTKGKPYEGYIRNKTFVINRMIGYRNSFIPTIKGEIESTSSGTRIHIKMRLHEIIYIFLGFWCFGVTCAFIGFAYKAFQANQMTFESLLPLGMLLFAYLLTTLSFKGESAKSKKDLENILDGRLIR